MRICILTFGTRGDVQPYVALGVGLQSAGHHVTIATLEEFEPLVAERGLSFDRLRGDFLKAAQASPNGNPFKLVGQYVEMARDTLADEWASAQKADALIYNSAALGGFSIAEKLSIPSFASFPAPMYTPTKEFPSPFLPFSNLWALNKWSHDFFAMLGPAIYRGAINDWRRNTLGLPPAKREERLNGKPVTILYAYSQAVVPRPVDWDESAYVSGYWFLDKSSDWQPDPDLVDFIQSGPPPVYVGFGSMFMNGGAHKTELVVKALKQAGQRGVLSTGWGGLTKTMTTDEIFVVDDVPHDWLFPQMAAVVHHGGAGTTASALRAGKPNIICPFVGDQHFWGRRISALGVGPVPVSQGSLTAEKLAQAIRVAVTDTEMRRRSASLGGIICAEDGVRNAVEFINHKISTLK